MGYRSKGVSRANLRVTSSVNKLKLNQMGAKLKRINSKIYHVSFVIGDTRLEYFYNINEDGKFFLERMKPYYKNFKVKTDENEAIEEIYRDVQYFKNATNSHNYEKFLNMSIEMGKVHDAYAEMFLHHNIPEQALKEIEEHLIAVKRKVEELNKTTQEIKIEEEL